MGIRGSLAGIAVAVLLAACLPTRGPQGTVRIKVLAFNDFHGSLQSPGSFAMVAGQPAVRMGGIDYLAAQVAQLESLNPNHIVVTAGDLVGASPLTSSVYRDEGTIEAMNLLGLEVAAVGNHEFDAGVAELLRRQTGGCFPSGGQTCLKNHSFAGATFKYLAANVVYTASGRTIFPPYVLKRFQGVRVAFIGVGLMGTPTLVPQSSVAGLSFLDEADAVNALVPGLRAQGVHAIVVLIHEGGLQSPVTGPPANVINDCAGLLGSAAASPIVDVVSRLSDAVDLVISAHTHRAYNCRLPNSVGRSIPVTQAGDNGRILTNIDLTLDRASGRVTDVAADNRWISQPAADAPDSPLRPYLSSATVTQLRSLVAAYATAVAPVANRVIGSIAAPLPNVPAASGENPAGNLIADSELMATSAAAAGGATMAFVNGSGVRGSGFDIGPATYPRDVTYQEAFAVRPFANALVTMTLTAQNLKDLLEQQFAGCEGQSADKVLQISNGLHVDWSASAAPCSKIVSVTLQVPGGGDVEHIVDNGVVRNPLHTYRVTVDSFLAAGGDSFGVFKHGTNRRDGPQDIDAVVTSLAARYKAPNPPYDPQDPQLHLPRIRRLP